MISFLETEDGSHTLRNEELDETYHSIHGAIQESNHVFISNGFHYRQEVNPRDSISVLEVGFGTGLNAFLTSLASQSLRCSVEYWGIETFPLQKEITEAMNYPTRIEGEGNSELFSRIHSSPWEALSEICATFSLLKVRDSIQNVLLPKGKFDLVYFDAFAPGKQPEMWRLGLLSKVRDAMNVNGVFVTYCAKGQLKRDLKELGLQVQTLDGPPGKMQMVRAIKR